MEEAEKYMNIVYKDCKVIEQEHISSPGHHLIVLEIPPGFRKHDFEVFYVPSQDCLVIQGHLPGGGNTLCRFSYKIDQWPKDKYQGKQTKANFNFRERLLTLKLPCKGTQIDKQEEQLPLDGQEEPPAQFATTAPRTPPLQAAVDSDDQEEPPAQFATLWLPEKIREKSIWLARDSRNYFGRNPVYN